jgi:hypothetical protein
MGASVVCPVPSKTEARGVDRADMISFSFFGVEERLEEIGLSLESVSKGVIDANKICRDLRFDLAGAGFLADRTKESQDALVALAEYDGGVEGFLYVRVLSACQDPAMLTDRSGVSARMLDDLMLSIQPTSRLHNLRSIVVLSFKLQPHSPTWSF